MIKSRSLLFLSLLLPWATAFAAERDASAPASESSADQTWAALEKTLKGGPPEPKPGATPGDQFVAIVRNITDYLAQSDRFFAAYPADPRRWEAFLNGKDFYGAALEMLEKQDAATKAKVDALISPAQREKWSQRLAQLETEFAQATDVPSATRYRAEIAPWFNEMFTLMRQELPEDSPEWTKLRAGLDRLATKYTDLAETRDLVKHYTQVRFSSGKDTPVRRAELASLEKSPNRFVQGAAREQIQFLDLARNPLELAFTAADGRDVDLKKMRGKVILIDFWATWCMPCIEEIPNVKKVYEQYHAKGFEVIGITLENPRLAPNDTDAQKQEKLEAARKRMLAFAEKHGMPWPQYFDGKWWKNDLARRYAIDSIPAMFLLDKEGRLVSTNARGPKLEAEVKRLLGL
jgi:thiol-disulfide isomerase/thioredoxin